MGTVSQEILDFRSHNTQKWSSDPATVKYEQTLLVQKEQNLYHAFLLSCLYLIVVISLQHRIYFGPSQPRNVCLLRIMFELHSLPTLLSISVQGRLLFLLHKVILGKSLRSCIDCQHRMRRYWNGEMKSRKQYKEHASAINALWKPPCYIPKPSLDRTPLSFIRPKCQDSLYMYSIVS